MTDPIDLDHVVNWPPLGHNVGSVAHVHAFGQIALTSAMLEEMVSMLLIQRLPIPPETATPLIHGLNNRERIDWLRAMVISQESDATVHGLFIYAIHCFDICNDNRNTLIHALYEGMDEATTAIKLSKRARNDPLRQFTLQIPISQLRKIAEQMGETVNFMIDLWAHFRGRKALKMRDPDLPPLQLPPWPQKPAPPDRLSIPQPASNQKPPRGNLWAACDCERCDR